MLEVNTVSKEMQYLYYISISIYVLQLVEVAMQVEMSRVCLHLRASIPNALTISR